MLSFECANPVWGRTVNPHKSTDGKHDYTSGGSSGGEVALLSLDGSPLGFGSDVGGSLRIPAHFCGVYSMKPTPGRVTSHDTAGMCILFCFTVFTTTFVNTVEPSPGFDAIPVCFGPMGRYDFKQSFLIDLLMVSFRSVSDVKLGCEVVFGRGLAKVPLPFRNELNLLPRGKKFKFGYYLSGESINLQNFVKQS